MKDTEIEKLRQIVSRNDISGNEKVEMLIIFTENYHSIQLMQTAVVGQSEQFNCYNVKFSGSPHRCMKQCDMCKPKNI